MDDTPASGAWSVDATAPVTTITAAPSGTVATAGATIEFTADEQDVTFQCRLDGGAWAACTSPATLSGLALGSHTFQVRATDAVGNTDATPREATWAIAQTVPDTTITGGPSGIVAEFSATFTFTSPDPFASLRVPSERRRWEACTSPMFYPDLLPGDQTFEVRAKSELRRRRPDARDPDLDRRGSGRRDQLTSGGDAAGGQLRRLRARAAR